MALTLQTSSSNYSKQTMCSRLKTLLLLTQTHISLHTYRVDFFVLFYLAMNLFSCFFLALLAVLFRLTHVLSDFFIIVVALIFFCYFTTEIFLFIQIPDMLLTCVKQKCFCLDSVETERNHLRICIIQSNSEVEMRKKKHIREL